MDEPRNFWAKIKTVTSEGELGTDMIPIRKRICLDIDGVLADFVGQAGKLFNYDPAVVTTWDYYGQIGQTEETFWEAISAAGSDFWATIPPYEWMRTLHAQCELHAPTVLLTSPSKCPWSPHGKTRWIQKHFGKNFRRYRMGPAKEFCAAEHTILIDDSDANVAKFEQHGGQTILFPQPWNANRDYAHDPLAYTFKELARFS